VRAVDATKVGPVSEMAIVDTFTKLIFGEEEGYSVLELSIIQAFRAVDANVLRDSHRDMGAYLRNLGVREMIHLVSRLREHMLEGVEILTSSGGYQESSAALPRHPGNSRPH
jgi:hypothetical protein